MDYAELHCHSYFSFLQAASSPQELAGRAASQGLKTLALTDRDGLYGVIPFYRECRDLGIKPIVGSQVTVEGDLLILLCKDMDGYRNLSRLITRGRMRRPKGESYGTLADLGELSQGLVCLAGGKEGKLPRLLAEGRKEDATSLARRYLEVFGPEALFVELTNHLEKGDTALCRKLADLATELGVRCVATNGVRYATMDKGHLHDVLLCIKNRTTLSQSHHLRPGNHHRYLKGPEEMARPFREFPEALSNSLAIAEMCNVDLDFSRYRLPAFPVPEGHTHDSYLATLCEERLPIKYMTVMAQVRARLDEELGLIKGLGLSGYFLVVWDVVEFARRKGIPVQGRGSAANSLVAYLLGIAPVDPIEHNLFLGRFLNEEVAAIPDIDLDFAASRDSGFPDREDVIQYVYQRYGEENVAMVSTFVTFQARRAIREVGKVLEMPEHLLDRMAKAVGMESSAEAVAELEQTQEFRGYLASRAWKHFKELVQEVADVPRHTSIHVGGMLIAGCPISDVVPLEPARMEERVVCQWDKDMVEDAGLIKVDILGLGMLAVLRETADLLWKARGERVDLDGIPQDDPEAWRALAMADTVGMFQVESRAQMQSLPRTRPKDLKDLAVQVALIRPGPLQGNMVAPYIRRRNGEEPVTYLHPKLEPVLKETLGVVLFQEQVLLVAVAVAGFTPGQAEALRRAMSRKRSREAMTRLKDAFLAGARRNRIVDRDALQVFRAIEGFAQYGFCKSHALSFALTAYRSAYLKVHYPAETVAALLNNQPMGFYPAEVLVQDAKRHGVRVLPVDVNLSRARCSVEEGALRLGLLMVNGVGLEGTKAIEAARVDSGPFRSVRDFATRSGLGSHAVESLIQAGAFDCLGLTRRELLWQAWLVERWCRPMDGLNRDTSCSPLLPQEGMWEVLASEYGALGLSAASHPMQLLRERLRREGVADSALLGELPDGAEVKVAGMVVCRQRPPTAKGFAFLTLEDENGMVNVVVPPGVYSLCRSAIRTKPLVSAVGVLERRDGVLGVKARQLIGLAQSLQQPAS